MARLVWMAVAMLLAEKGSLVKGNCFDELIRDVTYTATSTDPGHSPSDAVLDNEGAWCTSQTPPNEYLEVDLGGLYDVCGVVLQGFKNDSLDSFTTKYKLSFSTGKPTWSFLLDDSDLPKEFQIAPDDGNILTENELADIRSALAVRIHPIETSGSPMCLRVGVYGTAALNVTCGEELVMSISISKYSLGPDLKLLYMNQRSPGCEFPVTPDSDITISIDVRTCGTALSSRGEYLYYENTVHGTPDADSGPLVFTHDVAFTATCMYNRTATLSSVSYTPVRNVTISASEYGDFDLLMAAYIDSNYTDMLTTDAQPVGTTLYISVEVRSTDKDLFLLLDRCWATPSQNRRDTNQRQLILDGCQDRSSVASIAHSCRSSSLQRFEYEVFKFSQTDRVYLHCEVVVCFAGVASSICKDKCDDCSPGTNRRRRSVNEDGYDSGSQPFYLEIGPLQIQDTTTEGEKDTIQEQTTTDLMIALAVSGVILVAIFVFILAVVIVLRSKSRPSEKSQILPPGSPQRPHAWSDTDSHIYT